MLKELIALSSIIGIIGGGPQRQYSHTENVGNTQVTYKYESNEVNSVNDIVQGNIYRFTNNYQTGEEIFKLDYDAEYFSSAFTIIGLYDYDFSDYTLTQDEILRDGQGSYLYLFDLIFDTSGSWQLNFCVEENGNEFTSLVFDDCFDTYPFMIDCIGFFREYHPENLQTYQNFSYTDYNEIESVDYTPPSTIIGTINEFCETYLFSEIPMVNQITFNVGGQEISLMTYLVIIFGLITAIGLFVLLIYVFKWLFTMFANCFKPNR